MDKEETQEFDHRINIRELNIRELQDYVAEIGYPKYVGTQIFDWLHRKSVFNFENMTNLSQDMREHLIQNFVAPVISIKRKLYSNVDDTIKYLFELSDGECVEAVVMKYKYGYTLCISTQAGCKMGCKFCASSVCKFTRNLSISEMLDEIMLVEKDLNTKILNLVLMGIGEPLDNLDNVVKFLKMLPCKYGLNLGLRRVTVSTCGLVDKIYELMKYRLPVTLSISLHATTDEVRDKIMPVNKKWNIESLIKAADDYFNYTSRRVSFEYVLINELNDSPEQALELVRLLGDRVCHVNLIPLNDIKERNFKRSIPERVFAFQKILRKYEINTTVRRELGADIRAACGQLRRKEREN
ncbi:MAG: 23S rRNA (adenine(2503)-C(2))-methyltransferase RlmN [Oscillospiraceae bacterium]|nr:23S rRNA (adenine(2503)-C(2))-methyltransferase RlmN [Oscillospiraceae bacterium]